MLNWQRRGRLTDHGTGNRAGTTATGRTTLCQQRGTQRFSPLSQYSTVLCPRAVPCASVHHLWDAFNDIAEGFGLTSEEMCEILRVCLKDILSYTEKKLDAISR